MSSESLHGSKDLLPIIKVQGGQKASCLAKKIQEGWDFRIQTAETDKYEEIIKIVRLLKRHGGIWKQILWGASYVLATTSSANKTFHADFHKETKHGLASLTMTKVCQVY